MRIVVISLIVFFLNVSLSISDIGQIHLPNKCGTFLPEEKKKFAQSLILNEEFRPALEKNYSSQQGNFLVHYDITGKHTVPLTDNDQNGIPDYVDSVAYYFEYVYEQEVQNLGYISPIPDSGHGGTDQYDVYLVELGDSLGWYGYTEQEIQINTDQEYPTFLSFIVVDNNFSTKDSILDHEGKLRQSYNTFGIDALKITAAHEFYHAIQFMYGNPIGIGLVSEMTSVFMETALFPEIDDYLQYLRNYLDYPFLFSFASSPGIRGYQFVGFALFLESKYGVEFFRRFWEVIGERNRTFKAMEILMEEFSSDFNEDWLEFSQWVYHTGSRAIPGMYFKDADKLPEIFFERDTTYSEPSFLHSSEIGAYTFEANRVVFRSIGQSSSGILDILVTDIDFSKGLIMSESKDDFTILCRSEYHVGADKLELGCYYKFIKSSEYLIDILYQYHDGNTENINYPFPQPYMLGTDETLHLPVPQNAKLSEKADIVIYNSSMQEVSHGSFTINSINGKRVVSVPILSDDFSSGVYIFHIVFNDGSLVGKFTVK